MKMKVVGKLVSFCRTAAGGRAAGGRAAGGKSLLTDTVSTQYKHTYTRGLGLQLVGGCMWG